MRVFFVLSELVEDGWNPYEPPEWGCLVEIVRAETHSKAVYLAMKKDRRYRHYKPVDWPRVTVRLIGESPGEAGCLNADEAREWWDKTDGLELPERRRRRAEDVFAGFREGE